ncbi:hypothetical protein RB13247 [Rhodopirellula baltica SH 1]|uniref:Uncharacterized protein n=1 Tax=Rhodopirellula baltica (strain DSM 10527 / NCIMB 13988 / SH1) TaxID=243090 RepID=Q7UHE9_RHOBA|nr:hypothetical protein RB13247 [Rhodopirellula baltica SH 1]
MAEERSFAERGQRSTWFGASVSVDDTVQPVDQLCFVKIDEQPNIQIHQTQIRQSLRFVDGMDLSLRFQFNDHQLFHQEISTKSTRFVQIVVLNRDRLLLHDRQTSLPKFVCQTTSINMLQEPRTESAMNFDRGTNDYISHFIRFHLTLQRLRKFFPPISAKLRSSATPRFNLRINQSHHVPNDWP